MTLHPPEPHRSPLAQRPTEKLRLSVAVYPSGLLICWLTSYMQQSGSYAPPRSTRSSCAFEVARIGDPLYLLRTAAEELAEG